MLCDKLVRVSVKDNRGWLKPGEESPSSIGQWCQITSGGGDSKDSATEIDRQACPGKDGKVG